MTIITEPTIPMNDGLKVLYSETIKYNPYIPLTPYTKQLIPIIEANKPEQNKQVNSILVGAGGYGGKGLSLDTVIPTDTGFKTMGDIQVGDLVFTEKGELTPVIAVSTIHHLPCFKFIFDDGTEVICDEDHLWFTSTYQSRRAKQRAKNPQVMDSVKNVQEIINTLHHIKSPSNHAINNSQPVKPSQKSIPIPAYTLGAWLGDGSSHGGGFTCNDSQIINEIEHEGFTVNKHKAKFMYGIIGLKVLLKENNLLTNKYIPSEYFFADYNTRLSLIQGLMDTDGNINKDGQCEFINKNKEIVNGLRILLASIGVKSTIRTKKTYLYDKYCGLAYRLKFKTQLPVFRSSRKKMRLPLEIKKADKRYIVDIVPVDSVPTKCIMVANPTSLYLCTESFIPTHNTILGSMLAAQYLMEDDYTCLVTRRNYAELLDTNSIWENLSNWCTDTTILKDNQVCDVIKSPTPRIIAPNGNTIYFKAFDREDKKGKFKSASYDRIINDEASELPAGILQFQYRSMRNTSWIPRSIINLSNPGGESTDYLVEHYVDGPNPYVALDWRDNPFIDREAYKQSLLQLDYIDQQYQMHGNWHYRASAGDLINLTELKESYVDSLPVNTLPNLSVIAIDMAGKGRDRFVATHLILYSNGLIIREDSISIKHSYPEDLIYNFIEEKAKKYFTKFIDFEREPGGDSIYSKRHWKEVLKDLIFKYNLIVDDVTPFASKYNRARPVAKAIKDGRLKFYRELETDTMRDGLFDQFINISPDLDEMKKLKSPDELDSLGYAFNRVSSYAFGGARVS